MRYLDQASREKRKMEPSKSNPSITDYDDYLDEVRKAFVSAPYTIAKPEPKPEPPAVPSEVAPFLTDAPAGSFETIIGQEEALSELRAAIEGPIKQKGLYQKYSLPHPKGALLFGPPGCGKTLFAKAAASELSRLYNTNNSKLISLSGTELQSSYVGETEKRIKAIFNYARAYKAHYGHPLLIFFDEAEALFPDRNSKGRRVYGYEESQVATFLAEIDGMKENGAFLLLATNRQHAIDEALLRDGRCDFKIQITRPSREAVETILRLEFEKKPIADTIEDLTFAALESLYSPHNILKEGIIVDIDFEKKKIKKEGQAFLLEHIMSGAIAASIPNRAARVAFAREVKGEGPSGISIPDVLTAITRLFEENKPLDHSFALKEFVENLRKEHQ
ncbi:MULTISPECIES: AAA family ATPase [unclassified Roseobacter]|uniref:AAA family ATPase n=1 Tax=unclassified Roseobacter TaxID=196798 RepID=UPI001491E7A5|nr:MULTISPECIES: AAA family ATPase [unclassified Roseobacter]NNW55478.1 AAA family ATPase [Roseobacter sp. HKCCD8284]NNY17335.1 AAA family ATPase [Roseobacter sp. HKCCD8191]